MPSFAIIAEGVTDQAVLENILIGYFGDEDEEPVVNLFHPKRDTPAGQPAAGGWTLVLRALREGKHVEALQFNDYVVLQIDTDRSMDTGFDVSGHAPDGQSLDPEQLVEQVKMRLVREMGRAFYEQHGDRIVFAIAVDAVECWLLPLLYDGEPSKKAKITGCLEAADWKLRRLQRPSLSTAGSKSLRSYEQVSRPYAKRRHLMQHRDENPSLDIFVRNLEELRKPASGGTDGAAGTTPQGSPAEPAGAPGTEPSAI